MPEIMIAGLDPATFTTSQLNRLALKTAYPNLALRLNKVESPSLMRVAQITLLMQTETGFKINRKYT